jgi:hypothetical protein
MRTNLPKPMWKLYVKTDVYISAKKDIEKSFYKEDLNKTKK